MDKLTLASLLIILVLVLGMGAFQIFFHRGSSEPTVSVPADTTQVPARRVSDIPEVRAELLLESSVGEKEFPEVCIEDTIYLILSVKNAGNVPLEGITPIGYGNPLEVTNARVQVDFFCPDMGMKYCVYQEDYLQNFFEDRHLAKREPLKPLEPGQLRRLATLRVELPPLDEGARYFWDEIRAMILKDRSVRCILEVTVYPDPSSLFSLRGTQAIDLCGRAVPLRGNRRAAGLYATDSSEVPQKQRTDEEQLFERWRENTSKKFLPMRENGRRFMTEEAFLSLRSIPKPIEIDGRKYNDVVLLKTEITRKPMYPSAPQTVEGWQVLEAFFSPSTVRDEIQYRRMMYEYYTASSGEKREKKREEILSWLMTLPYAQREIMAADFELKLPKIKDKKREEGELRVPIL